MVVQGVEGSRAACTPGGQFGRCFGMDSGMLADVDAVQMESKGVYLSHQGIDQGAGPAALRYRRPGFHGSAAGLSMKRAASG